MDGMSMDRGNHDYGDNSAYREYMAALRRKKEAHEKAQDLIQQQIKSAEYPEIFKRTRFEKMPKASELGNIQSEAATRSWANKRSAAVTAAETLITEINKETNDNPFSLYFKLLRLTAICAHCQIFYVERPESLKAVSNLLFAGDIAKPLFSYIHHCLTILVQHVEKSSDNNPQSNWRKLCDNLSSKLKRLHEPQQLAVALKYAVLLELRLASAQDFMDAQDATYCNSFWFAKQRLLSEDVWSKVEQQDTSERLCFNK